MDGCKKDALDCFGGMSKLGVEFTNEQKKQMRNKCEADTQESGKYYKKLLEKYMQGVIDYEGVPLIDEDLFSEEELSELTEMANGILKG